MEIYGYARISRKEQSIERQISNIKEKYPKAYIFKEAYTGTKILGRKELDKLLKIVKPGDRIIFDSASRMSRNEDEALELYKNLYNKGVELEFLKEPMINTEVYRNQLSARINLNIKTGKAYLDNFTHGQIELINNLLVDLAKEQIKIVFAQAQKEVDDLHQRTSEGLREVKRSNELLKIELEAGDISQEEYNAKYKRIGNEKGVKLQTKKSQDMKKKIIAKSKSFKGSLNDTELIAVLGINRNTFYKYKKELLENEVR